MKLTTEINTVWEGDAYALVEVKTEYVRAGKHVVLVTAIKNMHMNKAKLDEEAV